MSTPSSNHQWRPKLGIAMLATSLSLLGGAQALAAAPAAAMDDLNELSECTQGTDWSYVDDVGEDCSEGGGGGGGQSDAGVPSGGEPPSDGRNEIIEVAGTAPETGSGSGVHPVGGPSPSQSSRGGDGQGKSGPRGGGSRSGPAKPEEPPRKWPHWADRQRWEYLQWKAKECRKTYIRIQKFYDDERQISRGELGFWKWFFTSGIQVDDLERYVKEWKRDDCSDLYPVTVY